jgi:hypothetical protein
LWKEINLMADTKKDKLALVKVSDLNDDELDAAIDAALDSLLEAPDGGEPTKETKSAVRKPSIKKTAPTESNKEESLLRGGTKSQEVNLEENHPGITEQIRRYAEAELPSCPHCGSDDTASVQVGMVGRAVTIAASTTKVKLVPNAKDKLGLYFCNACKKYFN